MRIFFALFIFVSFITIASLYIAKEDGSLDPEINSIKHTKKIPLEQLHNKFLHLDMDSKELDLDKEILEIKKARAIYPLDDKLKMIDIELEHKRANKAYQTSKY